MSVIDFIQNPWTIGIGGGLVSGFLVFFITNKIFSRKENKEYQQRLNSANNELLYAIRPLIVSKQVPKKTIIEALIVATALRFNVKNSDLHDAKNMADSLTKEILDNPFLDSESKLSYCDIIQNMRQNEDNVLEKTKKEIIYLEKNKTLTKDTSFLLATVSMMTASGSIIFMFGDYSFSLIDTMSIVFFATTLPIAAVLASLLLKNVRKKIEHDSAINIENKIKDIKLKED